MFTAHQKFTLPTLSDAAQGAEVYLKAPNAKELSPVSLAAYKEFMEVVDAAVDCEWHIHIIALLLDGQAREAMDFLNNKIATSQAEGDPWGEAADRGNDARGM
jgi:hypothetical protein